MSLMALFTSFLTSAAEGMTALRPETGDLDIPGFSHDF
jgi:hypothetical protein